MESREKTNGYPRYIAELYRLSEKNFRDITLFIREIGEEADHNEKEMERETRFELATSTLARLHSTTELFPLTNQVLLERREYNETSVCCQQKTAKKGFLKMTP